MDGQPTRGGRALRTPAGPRALLAFLRQPVLPERVTGLRLAALGATLGLFALDVAMMALLVGLGLLVWALGITLPTSMVGQVELGPGLVAAIIVAAPIGEELLFRSWLSGRPGHLAAFAIIAATLAILVLGDLQDRPFALLGALVGGIALAIGLAIALRRRAAFAFFARHFRWFYYASAVLFALVHVANYSVETALFALPLVLPQLVAGLIFGYARVTFGLWSNILLHMLHNGLFISLVLVALRV
jgi:membrane protease YdiL (CAAX protease family)